MATPSDLISNQLRTPFNIGRAIELTGFKLAEAQPLAVGLATQVENSQAGASLSSLVRSDIILDWWTAIFDEKNL